MTRSSSQIIFTNKARCRDCYRCIRACPVKAIKMYDSQAYVIEERCIGCGTCIRECPQKAKTYRTDIEKASEILKNKESTVIASIAPSFAALFSGWKASRIPSALRQLGFDFVTETAVGATITALNTAEYIQKHGNERGYICSPCPATVLFIEKYIPDLVGNLLPITSPIISHAKYLREKISPKSKIIFISPCLAKKIEIQRPEYEGLVECALTFEELNNWLIKEKIDLSRCEESDFDFEHTPEGSFFPINGGIIQCSGVGNDATLPVITASGEHEVREALQLIREKDEGMIIDPLFCLQGCINGPAIGTETNIFHRRNEIINYAKKKQGKPSDSQHLIYKKEDYQTTFQASPVDDEINEAQIREMLEKTGKSSPENQLNCGSCGYNSCREKAIAVIKGLAEENMCVPLMRRRAEQKSDMILERSPNGIVLLNEKLQILSMNKAFRSFFIAGEGLIGKHISYLIDPAGFEELATGTTDLTEGIMNIERYGIVCHYLFYTIKEINQYVGIFVNITSTNSAIEKLSTIKKETVELAQTLLVHELEAAQKYASMLGENTAKTEVLVNKLMALSRE